MNFTNRNIITTAIVATTLLPVSSSLIDNSIAYADTVEYRVVNANSVRFRQGPSTSHKILGVFNKGDKVEYISQANSWTKIKYNNKTGYIYSTYISKIENTVKTKYVNCSSLNVRTGAGTNYSVITTIKRDTKVEVLSTNNSWSKIKVNNTTGYVYSTYLSDFKSSASNGTNAEIDNTTSKVDKVLNLANSLINKPYLWGAQGPNSFDCSGFTYYVYKNSVGITLPRVSREQANYGTTVSKSNLKKGDLVFFDTNGSNNGNVSHVGIYIGSNQFIHASSSKGKVVISSFSTYYNNAFVRAKRVL